MTDEQIAKVLNDCWISIKDRLPERIRDLLRNASIEITKNEEDDSDE